MGIYGLTYSLMTPEGGCCKNLERQVKEGAFREKERKENHVYSVNITGKCHEFHVKSVQ